MPRHKDSSKGQTLSYVSLFSGAGVGCNGFNLTEFNCVATNEVSEERLNIQKYNNKCEHDSGYILGDLSQEKIKKKVYKETEHWKRKTGLKEIDVVVATPPCQGMSVANHNKKNELKRNSLVVESIIVTKKINPKIFLFENVRTFLNTKCTDSDGNLKSIKEAIESNLTNYNVHSEVINFKDYGSPSQRTRTLVIGVRKDLIDISPLELFPSKEKEKTVRQTIGKLKPLKKMGEIDYSDIYHSYRKFPKYMLKWIENLKEGQSAFENRARARIPHRIKNDKIVFNKNKSGDKYKRCYWDKPAYCIHTRNDILASQWTIHPRDHRVFSIREIMKLMTIPRNFKWSKIPFDVLNHKSLDKKRFFLKKNELNIRRCVGEAVPTIIFRKIAGNIRGALKDQELTKPKIIKIIEKNKLDSHSKLKSFINTNLKKYSYNTLSKIAELSNAKRLKNSAYYTPSNICFSLVKDLPDFKNKKEIHLLEPAVGAGNFLPSLIAKYKNNKKVSLDVIDIDKKSITLLKILVKKLRIPNNFKIKYINADFIFYNGNFKYDVILGNPPFKKVVNNKKLLKHYKRGKNNKDTNNLFSFFIERAITLGDFISFIVPKSLLSTPEFNKTRELMNQYNIVKIVDFGEKAFDVKIETIGFILKRNRRTPKNMVKIESYVTKNARFLEQLEMASDIFPYWLIYRNNFFNKISKKMKFDIFKVFRDRQITNKILYDKGKYRVLKSRNIGNNKIKDISGYDKYISNREASSLTVKKFLNSRNSVLIPNLTYYPRACFMPENAICDGSVAIAQPKNGTEIDEKTLNYYSTSEFREFYSVARNRSTRSMNIDSNSIYFFGKLET